MRIVHVIRQFHPSVGGLENVAFELAAAQVAEGHWVRVVTLDRLFNSENGARLPATDRVSGIEVVRIPYVGSTRYPISWSVLKHITNADIVHVHAIDFFFDYLAWTKLLHRKTLVVSTHGGFFHTSYAASLKRLWFATVTRLSLMSYAGVAAVSASDYRRFEAVRPSGMVCIENGVDIHKFANASSLTFRKSIASIGRFSKNKRIDLLVSFLRELRGHDPDWTLTVAGQPSDLRADDVNALCAAAGVLDAVTIVASPSDATIRDIIARSSFIASASEYEGFGLAAVEGMSAGLYPLLSDITPFRRLIERAGAGLLLDFSDPAAAARQTCGCEQLIRSDYGKYRSMFIDVATAYDWCHVSRAYTDLYEAAIGTKVRAVLDVPVRVQTFAAAAALLDSTFAEEKQAIVAFANAHTLTLAAGHSDFRAVLQESIVLNDGVGLDIASWALYGAQFPENLNGTDFVPRYLAETKYCYRIFLLGAKPGVAARAARRLSDLYPRHEVVGHHHGYFAGSDADGLVELIRSTGASVVLVALGNPSQELWLHAHLHKTGCTLGFGVGALFDFLAGEVPRASPWLRRLRFEWLHRLALEPKRLARRYLIGTPLFLYQVFRQYLSGQRSVTSSPP